MNAVIGIASAVLAVVLTAVTALFAVVTARVAMDDGGVTRQELLAAAVIIAVMLGSVACLAVQAWRCLV